MDINDLRLKTDYENSFEGKGKLELGYQSLGGNSDSESLNTRVGLTYVKKQLRQTVEAKYLLAEKDGEEDKRKGQLELQSDLKVNEKTYVLGNANYVDDKYGPYFTDFTLSTGLGYQLLRLETFQMEVELGPGYRHQEPNIDEIDDDDILSPVSCHVSYRSNDQIGTCRLKA